MLVELGPGLRRMVYFCFTVLKWPSLNVNLNCFAQGGSFRNFEIYGKLDHCGFFSAAEK